MKLSSFETRAVMLPRPVGPQVGGTAPFVTLRLRTDDGIEGIGYAGFVAPVLLKALKATVDALAELTLGADPWQSEALEGRLLAMAGGGQGGISHGAPAGLATVAIAAIDIALWDIKGKSVGLPVWKLLGGFRNRVPTYASGELWRNYTLDQLTEAGPRLIKDGYKAMKFRLGSEPTAAKELERVKVMREAVGPDVTLMIDINQSWTVDQAINIGRGLAEYDIFWLEDPTHHQDYAGLARIADALDTSVCAGEYHFGIAPHRQAVEQRSVDIVMVDLMRAPGISGWMKVAHMAEAFNLPIVTHLAPEVLMHAAAAAPNALQVEYMPWSSGLFTEAPKVEDGELVLPSAPGLGLEFDNSAIEKYALA
jgi:L-alanine-DL-glutamate epimerase-like enolase superfamily enzyme